MESHKAGEHVVKEGIYLFGCSVECDLRVLFSPIRFGTGDVEDDPEVREDILKDTYYIQWGSVTERGVFAAGSSAFESIQEAVAAAESTPGIGDSIRWRK